MTAISLHRPPRAADIARRQLRTVGRSVRREALLLFIILCVVAVIVLLADAQWATQAPAPFGATLDPTYTLPTFLLGLLMAAGVWQRELPSRRGYHFAMPLAVTTHTWTRVFAGWAWLMAGVFVLELMIVALTALIAVIGGGAFATRALVWFWIAPLVSATIVYLLTSIAMIASEKPLLWIVGVPSALVIIPVLFSMYRTPALTHFSQWVVNTPLSPIHSIFQLVMKPQVRGPAENPIDAARTLETMAFWLALSLGGVWLAVRRRPPATR